MQLTLAGNDTQGLRYAPILAPEKYWLKWKLPKDVPAAVREQIETECAGLDNKLDRATAQMLDKRRLLELVHDFTVFDQGVRKICRPNQYFGVLAAQLRRRRARGRHHLAHPGFGEVAHDGVAGQVAA